MERTQYKHIQVRLEDWEKFKRLCTENKINQVDNFKLILEFYLFERGFLYDD